MLLSARRTLRSYRYDKQHPMNSAEFHAHMLNGYETAVVSQVYEDLGMGGPRLARKLTLDEKINLRARRQQP
jgi:hypothetical protein